MPAMDTPLPNDTRAALESLYAEMRPASLYPLWEVLHALVTPAPTTAAQPWRWEYAPAREYLLRAGGLISAEQAERRVLILENPGLPGTSAATNALYAGLQLILPGEVAPCHRHTQSALRFVMEGHGAHTAVDGEKAVMEPFDLVLTPNWQWHDHGNDSGAPMIWLDGLDIPTVRFYAASFAERMGGEYPETAPAGDTAKRYGRNLRPFMGSVAARRPAGLPLFHYPYREWRESLAAMARDAAPDPRPSAHVRLLPKGFSTAPRRATDGTIFVVVEGTGRAMVAGETIPLAQRDLLVVPSWSELTLHAESDLVLFGYSDRAAQEKLGLWREG